MGILKRQAKALARSLAHRSLIGRAPGCFLQLEDRAVSAEHAAIFWTGERWEVRDLGSSNGTFVDGRRLAPGQRVALWEGAPIAFGAVERWVLVDALPPVASARRLDTGEVRSSEGGLLALPGPAEPIVSVFVDERGQWLVEADGPARPGVDQEEIVAGVAWRLSIPPPAPCAVVPPTTKVTDQPMLLDSITLCFTLSRDEEYIELSIDDGIEVTPLSARAHHELLLALARARIAADPSLPPAERGWVYVDDLLHMLKINQDHLTVNVFRARQQLVQAGIANAGALVERRMTTRQMRLGTDRIAVRMF